VIRIRLPYLFRLAQELEPLGRLPFGRSAPYNEIFLSLATAEHELMGLVASSVFSSHLRSSLELAGELLRRIRAITQEAGDFEREIDEFRIYQVRTAYDEYKIALLAELGVFPSYFVTQKGAFDTLSLLDYPQALFPADLKDKVPEAMFDIAEAGKALAYDIPTSCGFHVFRAVGERVAALLLRGDCRQGSAEGAQHRRLSERPKTGGQGGR
jgi:hypothetical protein